MSDNIIPLKTVLITDPRLELSNTRTYGVLRGGQNVSWLQFPANSVSASSVQVTANPPSRRHVINRRVYLNVTFNLTFSGSGGTDNILQPEFDAPRAYPLSTIITSQTMTFGNASVQLGNFNEYWPYLLRYHNNIESQDWNYGMTPSQMDQFQNLGDFQNKGATTTTGWGAGGTARNPLAFYGENSTQTTRGGFAGLTVLTNTTNSATATLTVTELIYMSPLIFARGDSESGFTGIEQMTYNAQFGTLSNIWSHAIANTGAQPFNTPTVTIASAQLLFEYLEPSQVSSVPRALSYPYFTIQPSITQTAVTFPAYDPSTGAPPSSKNLTNLNLQLNGVPRRMYIFCRPNQAGYSYLSSDTALVLNRLTVTFDTNTYLSQASQQDLYQMSRKNGVNLSWSQWSNYTGSVMCCEFATDIGLNPLFAPGVQGTHQLLITGQFYSTNTASTVVNPTLYVIVIFEGTANSVDGTVLLQQNVLSNADALNAKETGGSYRHSESIFGGNFFSDIGNVFKDTGNAIWDGTKILSSGIKQGLDVAGPILSVAKLAGVGALGGAAGGIRSHMRHMMHGGRRMMRSSHLMGRGLDDGEEDDSSGGHSSHLLGHEGHGQRREETERERYERHCREDREDREKADHGVTFADEHGGDIAEYSDGEDLSGESGDAVEAYIQRRR